METAIKDLGVDLQDITQKQERQYFKALESCMQRQKTVEKIAALPKEAAQESERRILGNEIQPHTQDNILSTTLGFYKLSTATIGEGGWGEVYTAEHYSHVD
ncbi:MAG: hypothetical protein EBU01_10975, partial [Crocinitomicaceae bacterium]|nr:hypothetical protein [Crocinitomicaceae bacterium]